MIFFFLISFIPLTFLIFLKFFISLNRQHTEVIKPGNGLAKWEQHKSSKPGSEVSRHERNTCLCSELPWLSRGTAEPNSCGLGNTHLRYIFLLFKAFFLMWFFSAALHSLELFRFSGSAPAASFNVHEYNPICAGGVILLHKISITFNCFPGMEALSQG